LRGHELSRVRRILDVPKLVRCEHELLHGGKFDVAQYPEQMRQTPIRMVELTAEQTLPNSLIPELMVDAALRVQWQYSLPDL